MKQLNFQCASLMIEELPRLVCYMRQNFCGAEMSGLTMQQQRVMATLVAGAKSTTELAQDLGVSLPAISRMAQGLILEGWVKKSLSKTDKRQIELSLTKAGSLMINSSREKSLSKIIPRLDELSERKKKTIIEAFEILKSISESTKENIDLKGSL